MKHSTTQVGAERRESTLKQRVNEAVDDYLRHRKSGELAKGTLINDKVTLTAFLRVVPSNIFCENVTAGHIDALFSELAESRSARTRNNDHFVLTGFFEWCRDTNRMPKGTNPMRGRKPPKFVVEERRRLPVTQFPVLLDAAKSPRDRILLAAALYLLARANEITKIQIGDIDPHSRRVLVHLSKKRARGAKGTDRMPITKEFRAELDRWFAYYQETCGPLQPHWHLVPPMTRPKWAHIPGRPGRGMFDPATQIPNIAKRWEHGYSQVANLALESIGFEIRDQQTDKSKGEGMHTLRRSGARARYDALKPKHPNALRHIQMLLHHAKQSETENYIGAYYDMEERDALLEDEYMYPQLAPQPDVIPLRAGGDPTTYHGVDDPYADDDRYYEKVSV